MFEKKENSVAPVRVFIFRVILNLAIAFSLIGICLLAGMWGYHHFEHMSWIDAYVNAAMILSGMGPVQQLQTAYGKLFAGTYALFSGIIFLLFMALIFAPIFHRFYHRFHFKEDTSKRPD